MDKEQAQTGKYTPTKEMGLLDPQSRIKALYDNGTAIQVHHNTPIRRYYRSGIEMIRMADVYANEGNLENAYILYLKFMTIFLYKVREHPHYNTVAVKDRAINQETLREVLPKAEALKVKLLAIYKAEYAIYLADAKQREKAEKEGLVQKKNLRLEKVEDEKNKLLEVSTGKGMTGVKGPLSMLGFGSEGAKISQPSPLSLFSSIAADFVPLMDLPDVDKKRPSIDRSTKPAALRDDESTLRDIVLPSKIMHEFLVVSSKNTTSNKETCGILAGTLTHDKLLVTHLLIPHQIGSPDSCVTHNEEDIFDYQDQHNLITLGWIHTHPTQTAFLSSVDLHTHCAYQLMMGEAIAIVCAPKYDETGFFMLTPDYGLNFIAACRQIGFHPHPSEPPLYMKAIHCRLSTTAEITLVDLRKK